MTTALITDDQLDTAARHAQLAEQAVNDALAVPNVAHERLSTLMTAVQSARAHRDALLLQRTAQLEQHAARDAAEQTATKQLDAAVKRLRGQDVACAAAVGEAEAATAAALASIRQRNELVEKVRAELNTLGLVEQTGADHPTAAGPRWVRIRGETFRTLDESQVLGWITGRVRHAVLGIFHSGRAPWPLAGAGLVGKVPALDVVPRRRIRWPKLPQFRSPVYVMSPSGFKTVPFESLSVEDQNAKINEAAGKAVTTMRSSG